VSAFSIRVPFTGTRASRRVTLGRPRHVCALCIDPALTPNYKQFHVTVVIFVLNYVFLYITVTVGNEYRWNTQNPGSLTARSSTVSFKGIQGGGGGGCPAVEPPKNPKPKFRNADSVDIMISKVLHDFPFSRIQPLKSADDYYIRILKNELIKLKKHKKLGHWLHQGTYSYIRMYINTVSDSVMLYLQHDFCNIIFKIQHKLYIASGSASPPPPPERKILGALLLSLWTNT
jgi:hypothetical protein